MPTLVVTGAAGFMGRAVVARALMQGYAVRALDISPDALGRLRAEFPAIEAFEGSTTDSTVVTRAMGFGETRADAVIHTAALMDDALPWDTIMRVNVDGTRTVALAAKQARVPRFIHISSTMVYGFRFRCNINEDGPLHGCDNAYCESKIRGEAIVAGLCEKGIFDVVVVRPGDVYGPGSVPWVRTPLRRMRAGTFYVPSGAGVMNHVYIDNLVDALFAALTADAKVVSGLAYNVTDDEATPWDVFFRMLAECADLPPPPMWNQTAMWVALAMPDVVKRWLGLDPAQPPVSVCYATRPHRYDVSRVKRDLGYTPRVPLKEGMLRIAAALSKAK